MSSVSVVIPCYRYGHFLEDAVKSVLDDQPGVDVRVLIIDDASPDDSAEAARAIASRDPRVEVQVHPVNRGHIATYNEGLLDWADGEYSVLLSADDRLTPGALTRATALLDAHPEVGFAYGNVLWFSDGAALPTPRTTSEGWSVLSGHQWLAQRFRHAQTGIISPEVVVRTSVQQRVGGYDPRLTHVGDQEMWLRLAAHGGVGFVRGAHQAYYRRHGQNMSTGYTQLATLAQFRLAHELVLARCQDQLPEPGALWDLVHRRLAWDALLAAARSYDRGRTEQTPVDELVEFALETWPRVTRLPLYRTLQWRRRVGPRMMPYLQPFVLPAAAVRRAQSMTRARAWQLRGM